jgi:hypothetical protein
MKKNYKVKYFRKDFSGQDLSGQDLSSTEFTCCNFTDTNLANADCSNCDFTGCILIRTNCNRTNFANSCLACHFEPSDSFGITWTLDCSTFRGMTTTKLWWFSNLYFSMLIKPTIDDKDDTLRPELEKVFGSTRLERLKDLFKRRQF